MKKPYVLAISSDHHAHSRLGLCPPDGVDLGVKGKEGHYAPSLAQQWSWQCWMEYLAFVESVRRETKGIIQFVFNGDAVDGLVNRGWPQSISTDTATQQDVAEKVFKPVKAMRPDAIFMVAGTPAHVGPDSEGERHLSTWLHADLDYHQRLLRHNVLVDFRHVGKMGGKPWTRGAVVNLASEIALEYAGRKERIPDVSFRSHVHLYADSGPNCRALRCIVTPAFQLRTTYGNNRMPELMADIGGLVCIVYPDSTYEVRVKLFRPALAEVKAA